MEDPQRLTIQQVIAEKIAAIDAIANDLPAVVIIHNIKTTSVEYMSARGLSQLGVDLETVKAMGSDYYTRFFNPEDAKEYVPKVYGMLERNDEHEIVSFFQQVRFSDNNDWNWHFSTTKIFLRDENGAPIFSITLAFPVDPKHHITSKVSRLLEENTFLRTNYQRFAQLSTREQEILKLVTLGKSSVEIADKLSISEKTVNTHRRNIKVKLNVQSNFELSQYALAFDLI